MSSFKTLLINNLCSIKSIGNCDAYDCDMLDNLKSFLKRPELNINSSEDVLNLPFLLYLPCKITKTKISAYTFGYVGGYIAWSILYCINKCQC